MSLKDKNVVVTGGSRGLGLGLVEALVAHGARVTVVARDADALDSVRARLGVATISADVTDEAAAHRILAEVRPDILVLNAGAKPPMGRLDQLSWADFTATWETDVKAGLYWLQAALNLPLKPRKPRPGGIERRGRERIAAVGRLCRRQAHALDHGQIRQRRLGAEGPRDPLPGDRAAADGRRHRRRRRRRQRLCARHGHQARRVPGPLRRADAAAGVRRESRFACWTTRNMPRASPSGSRATRASPCSRKPRLERRTALAEPRPPGGAPRAGRRAAARAAPLLRAPDGIGHRRRGRRAGHAGPRSRGVAGL